MIDFSESDFDQEGWRYKSKFTNLCTFLSNTMDVSSFSLQNGESPKTWYSNSVVSSEVNKPVSVSIITDVS